MKKLQKLLAALTLVLALSACGPGGDKVTGSASLTDNLAGCYAREYKKDNGKINIKDTILIIHKDANFEVSNHHWFFDSLKPNEGYSKVKGFETFQGTFNHTDTTITHPMGGSFKFDVAKGVLYPVDKPDQLYIKVK